MDHEPSNAIINSRAFLREIGKDLSDFTSKNETPKILTALGTLKVISQLDTDNVDKLIFDTCYKKFKDNYKEFMSKLINFYAKCK